MAFLIMALISCTPAIEDKDPNVRFAAIDKINNQELLAKIALEDKDTLVSYAAIEKLSSQTLIAKVALKSTKWWAREIAVIKLNDQEVLAKVAIGDEETLVRKAAVDKLTSQTIISKVAFNEKDPDIRKVAVKKLTEQSELAKIAEYDNDDSVRLEAAEKLPADHQLHKIILATEDDVKIQTNQLLLFKIAKLAHSSFASSDAIEKLNDQVLLAKLGIENKYNDLELKSIKLALQDKRIQLRFPGIKYNFYRSEIGPQRYIGLHEVLIKGERITIKLIQNGKTIAEATWSTSWPDSLNRQFGDSSSNEFWSANISIEDLFKKLFRLRNFTSEDLVELCHSGIEEIRIGAVANLSDQTMLVEIAKNDTNSEVRKVAAEKLPANHQLRHVILASKKEIEEQRDQQLLVKIAQFGVDSDIRKAAVEKIIDEELLLKLIQESRDSNIRCSAIKKLDPRSAAIEATLVKLALENMDSDIPECSISRLIDWAPMPSLIRPLMPKFALEAKSSTVRYEAVGELNDQSAITRVALEDKDSNVRKRAIEKLEDQRILARILIEDKNQSNREAAFKDFTGWEFLPLLNQGLLKKFTIECKDKWNRIKAIGMLSDQVSLSKIALEDEDSFVRDAATGNINNQEVLNKIAAEDEDRAVRITAVWKITNQEILSKIAKTDKDYSVQEAAKGRIEALRFLK